VSKFLILKVTNSLLFITFVIQACTGVALAFHLSFSRPRVYEAVGEIHEYAGFIFIILAVIHISLNWSWIRNQLFKKR
jgi:quinol-cytochrome oxidoreductase complex cytochrome b subunit